MKKKKTDNKWTELENIVQKTGRTAWKRKDGVIVCQDWYDGCDAHYSDTIEDAIEWEKSYL